jgi:MerR family copper efflux transcriptional regulator
MVIHELAQQSGLSAKTIRYYESIGLLPRPKRASNNYRQYEPADLEPLRFIAGARTLGFSLEHISEILAARDNSIAPCQRVLDTIGQRINEIDQRIAALLTLSDSLHHLQSEGAGLPLDDVNGEHCICYLLKTYHGNGQLAVQKAGLFND